MSYGYKYTARLKKLGFLLLVTGFCVVSFFPVIWIALSSFKPARDLYLFPVKYWPDPFTIKTMWMYFCVIPLAASS